MRATIKTVKKTTIQLTTTRKTTKKTKDLQWMMAHALASTTSALTDSPIVAGHLTHCWDFQFALLVSNTIVVAAQICSILICTRSVSHRENGSFEVLSLHSVRLRFYPKTEHNGYPRSIKNLCMQHEFIDFELL